MAIQNRQRYRNELNAIKAEMNLLQPDLELLRIIHRSLLNNVYARFNRREWNNKDLSQFFSIRVNQLLSTIHVNIVEMSKELDRMLNRKHELIEYFRLVDNDSGNISDEMESSGFIDF